VYLLDNTVPLIHPMPIGLQISVCTPVVVFGVGIEWQNEIRSRPRHAAQEYPATAVTRD
jgi:hypothetical protein